MYFFYFDESGSRDPSAGTAEKPKDHLYVLLAVGMYEGHQLADLLAYSVYRAFKGEDLGYPYFERVLGSFYRRRQGTALDGLKVWPNRSPLSALATEAWDGYQQEPPERGGRVMSGWANHIEPIKGTRP